MVAKRDSQSAEERKLFLLCDEIGLTRDERIELAQYLLRRDITSFSELEPHQVCRLLDACEGHQLIEALKALRSPTHQPDDGAHDEQDDEDRPQHDVIVPPQ